MDSGVKTTAMRRGLIDLAILCAIGLLMGFLAPLSWDRASVPVRYLYWMICILGAGGLAIALDAWLGRRIGVLWRRLLAVSVLAAPPTALLVLTAQHLLIGEAYSWPAYLKLSWQAWPILLAVVTVRALAWRRPPARVTTRILIAPPLPEAEARFRRRLSARRRAARLIAVEAHDHYLKVHTDAGEELITLRFTDALDELSGAHGWRVHRSWWVAAEAVESVRWRRGAGEITLTGGLKAPVSRTHAPALKDAGWRSRTPRPALSANSTLDADASRRHLDR